MKQIIYDVLNSTQTEARQQLAKIQPPFVVSAKTQTSGYGKYGRVWESYDGNFTATFAVELNIHHYDFGKIPMIICIMLCNFFASKTQSEGAYSIKWPNDILLNKKKMGGILIEKIDNVFLIGIGLNLRQSPETERVSYPTANVVYETGVLIDTSEVLNELSDFFDQFGTFLNECDAAELRQTYMTLLEGQGQEIRVVLRHETLVGVLHDINYDGALIIDMQGEKKLIYSADVFV